MEFLIFDLMGFIQRAHSIEPDPREHLTYGGAMHFGDSIRSTAILLFLAVAGTLFPAGRAEAMIVSWVQCENVYGTVSDPYGSYTYQDVVCYEYSYDEGTGTTGGDYDTPGGPYGGGNPTTCQVLQANPIPNCSSPTAVPSTYDFGFSSYPSGSGLAYLIGYANMGGTYQISKILIKSALAQQTVQNTKIFVSMNDTTQNLLATVKSACEQQSEMGTSPTATTVCAKAYGRLLQEAGAPSLMDRFSEWLAVNSVDFGVGVGDFTTSIGVIMSLFAPENSLKIKHDKAIHDQQCHDWWAQAQEANCG